jgi:ankyrin repeat protein
MRRRRLSMSLPLLMAAAAGPFGGVPWAPAAHAARAAPAAEAGLHLIDAAARGDVEAVRQVLDAGAPIATRDARGRNAVLAATQGGHAAAARLLIERGADVNAQDDIADSAFLLAGARGHTEIVRAALPHADPKVLNRYGGTALIPACHYGHVETVRVLLSWRGPNRIDVDHVNRLGWTALLEAVILGDGGARHAEIVRLLLQHGADPNRADGAGVTPLTHARQRGQDAVAALIAAAGGR